MLGFNLVQLVTVLFPQNAPLFYLFLICIHSKWKLLSGVLRIKVSPPDPYYPLYQWLLSHPPSFSTLAHIHHIWIYPATRPFLSLSHIYHFFTPIRLLQGFPGFSSQVLSHPLFLVVPLNFCRQVFPPAPFFPEQSPLGNSAAAALECRCKDGSKKGGQEDIADWRGGSSPVHTHTRVDGLYFCISLF